MSRSKDRERYLARKRLDPTYRGFRGYELEPQKQPLKSLICSRCGRRRNVPTHVPEEGFVCVVCRGG